MVIRAQSNHSRASVQKRNQAHFWPYEWKWSGLFAGHSTVPWLLATPLSRPESDIASGPTDRGSRGNWHISLDPPDSSNRFRSRGLSDSDQWVQRIRVQSCSNGFDDRVLECICRRSSRQRCKDPCQESSLHWLTNEKQLIPCSQSFYLESELHLPLRIITPEGEELLQGYEQVVWRLVHVIRVPIITACVAKTRPNGIVHIKYTGVPVPRIWVQLRLGTVGTQEGLYRAIFFEQAKQGCCTRPTLQVQKRGRLPILGNREQGHFHLWKRALLECVNPDSAYVPEAKGWLDPCWDQIGRERTKNTNGIHSPHWSWESRHNSPIWATVNLLKEVQVGPYLGNFSSVLMKSWSTILQIKRIPFLSLSKKNLHSIFYFFPDLVDHSWCIFKTSFWGMWYFLSMTYFSKTLGYLLFNSYWPKGIAIMPSDPLFKFQL